MVQYSQAAAAPNSLAGLSVEQLMDKILPSVTATELPLFVAASETEPKTTDVHEVVKEMCKGITSFGSSANRQISASGKERVKAIMDILATKKGQAKRMEDEVKSSKAMLAFIEDVIVQELASKL